MNGNNLSAHRVVTFLTKEEMEYLDKLERDMIFSTGTHLSRAKIIESMVDILVRTHMDGAGIKDNEQLKKKVTEAIIDFVQKEA